MSADPVVRDVSLEEIPCPFIEPRIAYPANEARKAALTLIDGKTFVSGVESGDISPPGAPDVGFFHADTRFLSQLELKIGGYRTVVLASNSERSFASQIELTTGTANLRDTIDLPENTIHIRRDQLLAGNRFYDHFSFDNFNLKAVEFTVEISYAADFMDVFQVRGSARNRSGHYFKPVCRGNEVEFPYLGLDNIRRNTIVQLSTSVRICTL